jgi:hypothetical protein
LTISTGNASSTDVLELGAGFTQDNTRVMRQGDDLVLTTTDYSQWLRVRNHYSADGSGQIEAIRFSNGQEWNATDLSTVDWRPTLAQGEGVVQGSYLNELIQGGATNDVIDASSGDDVVRAGAGDDVLLGGWGNDTLDGGTHNNGDWLSYEMDEPTGGVTVNLENDMGGLPAGRHHLDGEQALVERLKSFGNDPGLADDGDEIGVTHPARDDMDMDVVVHPGSGGAAEVPSDIESLRLDRFAEELLGVNDELPELQHLVRSQVRHGAGLPIRHRHQVPGRIRVFVHDQKRLFAPLYHEVDPGRHRPTPHPEKKTTPRGTGAGGHRWCRRTPASPRPPATTWPRTAASR